jgi:hypothetical protein
VRFLLAPFFLVGELLLQLLRIVFLIFEFLVAFFTGDQYDSDRYILKASLQQILLNREIIRCTWPNQGARDAVEQAEEVLAQMAQKYKIDYNELLDRKVLVKEIDQAIITAQKATKRRRART